MTEHRGFEQLFGVEQTLTAVTSRLWAYPSSASREDVIRRVPLDDGVPKGQGAAAGLDVAGGARARRDSPLLAWEGVVESLPRCAWRQRRARVILAYHDHPGGSWRTCGRSG
jgi:hypothetical protein